MHIKMAVFIKMKSIFFVHDNQATLNAPKLIIKHFSVGHEVLKNVQYHLMKTSAVQSCFTLQGDTVVWNDSLERIAGDLLLY